VNGAAPRAAAARVARRCAGHRVEHLHRPPPSNRRVAVRAGQRAPAASLEGSARLEQPPPAHRQRNLIGGRREMVVEQQRGALGVVLDAGRQDQRVLGTARIELGRDCGGQPVALTRGPTTGGSAAAANSNRRPHRARSESPCARPRSPASSPRSGVEHCQRRSPALRAPRRSALPPGLSPAARARARLVHIAEVADRKLRDAASAVGDVLDEPGGVQTPKRFPDRHRAYPSASPSSSIGSRFSGRELAVTIAS